MLQFKFIRLVIILCLVVSFASAAFVGAQAANCLTKIDHAAAGQGHIEAGDYASAIAAFTCVLETDPVNVDAFRGRIEAALLAGSYADALADYTRVLATVLAVHPDAFDTIFASYEDRLAADPNSIPALTGLSFVQWYFGENDAALENIERILAQSPDDLYGVVFRGSNKHFNGDKSGDVDFSRALELAPDSAHVHFIIADGYVYGAGDLDRAFPEVQRAYELGLDTPRVQAMFAAAYLAQGDDATAARYIAQHINEATSETIAGDALNRGTTLTLDFVPGRTYWFVVEAQADETLTIIATSEEDGVDTILAVLSSDGEPLTGNDDDVGYNVGLRWRVPAAGTYTVLLTTFEGAGTGEVVLTRE